MHTVSREEFLDTPVGAAAKAELQRMVDSSIYNTDPTHDINSGGLIIFIDRHINYLVKHLHIKPASYISNLKVMTRMRR